MNEVETKQEIARLQAVLENQKRAQTDEIMDHISTVRKLTIPRVAVQEEVFTELVKAFEKLYLALKRKGVI